MRHSDFSIGAEFLTKTGRWRCTDVGTRTITAIKISDVRVVSVAADGTRSERLDVNPDPVWFQGPPYAVAEHVFDEDSISACEVVSE